MIPIARPERDFGIMRNRCYGKSLWDRQKSPDDVTLGQKKQSPGNHELSWRMSMITRARHET